MGSRTLFRLELSSAANFVGFSDLLTLAYLSQQLL